MNNKIYMQISTVLEYDKLKYLEKYEFVCKKCEKFCNAKKRNDRRQTQLRFLCSECGKRETNLLKYGTEFPQTLSEMKEKARTTSLQRYGTEYPSQSEEFQKKVESTNMKRYGVRRPIQNISILEKLQNTNIKRYGNRCTLQVSELQPCYVEHKHNAYIYKVNNYYMDSSWEVAFFIYHTDKGHIVKREPIKLSYIFNNKQYDYYPDFEIDKQLYEIKGEQFFNEKGELVNPYDSSQNEKLKEKQQCMIQNNVKILRKNDLQEVFNYMRDVYGRDWEDNYKVTRI